MTNELAKLNKATQMLAEAKTLDDIRQITSIADAAKAYARAAKLGLQAYNHAAEVKVRAERKAGEMLKRLERGKTGPKKLDTSVVSNSEYASVLAEHDIAPMTAHRWQLLADMPEKTFEKTVKELRGERPISTSFIVQSVKSDEKQKNRNALQAAGHQAEKDTDAYRVFAADIRGGIPDIESESIDAIVTDPPYPLEFVELYSSLGQLAARVLKPGGLLVAMSGHIYMPDIMARLAEHLTWHWIGAYTLGGEAAMVWPRRVMVGWKPLLVYSKGTYEGKTLYDVCKSPASDKSGHDWGQSVGGMIDIIEKFTEPEARILDPFLGAGATGIACLQTGRRFVGTDIEKANVDISAARFIGEVSHEYV